MRHRAPQVPDRLNRGVLFTGNEGFRINTRHFAQFAQEQGGRFKPDGRLQIRPLKGFAEISAKLTIEAHIHFRFGQLFDVGQMASQWENKPDLATNTFDQTADFGQVRWQIKHAIGWANDVDLGLLAFFTRLKSRYFFAAKIGPEPCECPVCTLPLIFINSAGQKALNIGAFRGHPTPDHLSDRAGNDHSRQMRI